MINNIYTNRTGYEKYNELLKVAEETRQWLEKKHRKCKKNPIGYCVIASFELYKRLRDKYNVLLAVYDYWVSCKGDGDHCFLVIDNDYVLDITADAFHDFGRVVFAKLKDNDYWHWQIHEVFDNEFDFIEYLLQEEWVEDELPEDAKLLLTSK